MKKMKFVVMFVLLVFAATAQATYVRTSDGNGADTYLSNDGQSGNYDANSLHGSDNGIKVRTAWGVRLKIGYVRFDIKDNDQFNPVSGAKLGVTVNWSKRSRTLGVYGLVDDANLDNWNEATICYNNAPGFIPNPPTPLAQYAMDANLVRVADLKLVQNGLGRYFSDPNSLMDAFINADTDGLVTFAIVYETTSTDTNPDWEFRSKEYDVNLAPILVPEPATIALLGLGGLGLIRRKR